MIKLQKFYVTDTETKVKAKVHYSAYTRATDGRPCVTLYAKEYDYDLDKIFAECENHSDSQTDYFEKSRVVLFEDHPLYQAALARAN